MSSSSFPCPTSAASAASAASVASAASAALAASAPQPAVAAAVARATMPSRAEMLGQLLESNIQCYNCLKSADDLWSCDCDSNEDKETEDYLNTLRNYGGDVRQKYGDTVHAFLRSEMLRQHIAKSVPASPPRKRGQRSSAPRMTCSKSASTVNDGSGDDDKSDRRNKKRRQAYDVVLLPMPPPAEEERDVTEGGLLRGCKQSLWREEDSDSVEDEEDPRETICGCQEWSDGAAHEHGGGCAHIRGTRGICNCRYKWRLHKMLCNDAYRALPQVWTESRADWLLNRHLH
jgi:hypothetical protein